MRPNAYRPFKNLCKLVLRPKDANAALSAGLQTCYNYLNKKDSSLIFFFIEVTQFMHR